MDLVEEDESGTIVITDWKTSARSYGIDEVDRNQQLTCYQMAAKANGFSDRQIILKFDTLIKTQKPKFEQYYSTRSDIDERRLIRKIHKVWEGIRSGVFIPNDTSWKCPNCHYRQACDAWFLKGGVSSILWSFWWVLLKGFCRRRRVILKRSAGYVLWPCPGR